MKIRLMIKKKKTPSRATIHLALLGEPELNVKRIADIWYFGQLSQRARLTYQQPLD